MAWYLVVKYFDNNWSPSLSLAFGVVSTTVLSPLIPRPNTADKLYEEFDLKEKLFTGKKTFVSTYLSSIRQFATRVYFLARNEVTS